MKISQVIFMLETQMILERTSRGRSITDYALKAIRASMGDKKNIDMDVFKCRNCCIIISGLLCAEGCPNCGSKDLNMNVTEQDIL